VRIHIILSCSGSLSLALHKLLLLREPIILDLYWNVAILVETLRRRKQLLVVVRILIIELLLLLMIFMG